MSLKHYLKEFLLLLLFPIYVQATMQIIDQDKKDITVVRARILDIKLGNLIQIENCIEISRYDFGYEKVFEFDCRDELESKLGCKSLLDPFRIYAREKEGGEIKIDEPQFSTPLVEIETLVEKVIFNNSYKLGFSTHVGVISFLSKELDSINTIELSDDKIGLIHRFVLPYEAQGEAYGRTIRRINFKPFIDFIGDDNFIYRNWDQSVDENGYIISNFNNFEFVNHLEYINKYSLINTKQASVNNYVMGKMPFNIPQTVRFEKNWLKEYNLYIS